MMSRHSNTYFNHSRLGSPAHVHQTQLGNNTRSLLSRLEPRPPVNGLSSSSCVSDLRSAQPSLLVKGIAALPVRSSTAGVARSEIFAQEQMEMEREIEAQIEAEGLDLAGPGSSAASRAESTPPPTPPRPSPEDHHNASLPLRTQDEKDTTDFYEMSRYHLYQSWKLTGDSKLKEIDLQLQQKDSQISELNEKVKRRANEILRLKEVDRQKTKEILELKEKVQKRAEERDREASANSILKTDVNRFTKSTEHYIKERDHYKKERDQMQAQVVKLRLEIQSRPHKDETDSSTIAKKDSRGSSDMLKEDKSTVMKRSLEQHQELLEELQSKRLKSDSENLSCEMVSVKSELFLGQSSQESILSEENDKSQPQVGAFKFLASDSEVDQLDSDSDATDIDTIKARKGRRVSRIETQKKGEKREKEKENKRKFRECRPFIQG